MNQHVLREQTQSETLKYGNKQELPSQLSRGRTGPAVLVADDDAACRAVLRKTLKSWGYYPIEATDGREAWNILQRHQRIRLAIVNWMMPEMDGLELCRLLEAVRPGELDVIVMAGRDFVEELSQRLPFRLLTYVPKPLDLEILKKALASADLLPRPCAST